MFALKGEHVRFLQDFIVWPICPKTETAQTETAQTEMSPDRNVPDRNGLTEKSPTPASFTYRCRQSEFTTNILAKIRHVSNFCKENILQHLHDILYLRQNIIFSACAFSANSHPFLDRCMRSHWKYTLKRCLSCRSQ